MGGRQLGSRERPVANHAILILRWLCPSFLRRRRPGSFTTKAGIEKVPPAISRHGLPGERIGDRRVSLVRVVFVRYEPADIDLKAAGAEGQCRSSRCSWRSWSSQTALRHWPFGRGSYPALKDSVISSLGNRHSLLGHRVHQLHCELIESCHHQVVVVVVATSEVAWLCLLCDYCE